MTEASQQLLRTLWEKYQATDSVFRELIELINNRNRQLAADAEIILVGLCSTDPGLLITQAISPGRSPAHRAKIIAVIGDIGQPLELFDAVSLVNHRLLQSKQAVEAVVQLFDRLSTGRGIGAHISGQMRYRLLRIQRPRSKGRAAG